MENNRSFTHRGRPYIRTLYRALILILSIACSVTVLSQKDKVSEYNLKAAFLYNFTKYVEWKAPAGENEFVIGIIGASPINDPLAEVVKTETVDGKKIPVSLDRLCA